MGLTAPVAAVLSAAIPTVFSMFTEGLPGGISIRGFFFAAIGLWLITRAEDGNAPEGIGLALFAGTGFAGFYLCVRQAGDASAFWIATFTRTGGLLITGVIVLLQRKFSDITGAGVRWGILTGCVDSLGTILFVRASQAGRLDEAVVISSLYPAVTVLLARHVPQRTFHPVEICRTVGSAGGSADDCGRVSLSLPCSRIWNKAMALVEVRNLNKIYSQGESPLGGKLSGRNEVRAVDDVSLDIHSGETAWPGGRIGFRQKHARTFDFAADRANIGQHSLRGPGSARGQPRRNAPPAQRHADYFSGSFRIARSALSRRRHRR